MWFEGSAHAAQGTPISIRSRNIAFLNAIGDALQLDRVDAGSWADAKRGITPDAVKKINQAIVDIWPGKLDLSAALGARSSSSSQVAFFSGAYEPHQLIASIGRHLIYADRVSLADPFVYPLSIRDEFSPLLHPGKHLTTTAKNISVWFRLAGLIDDGLVEIIRLPSDFDLRLKVANGRRSMALVEGSPDLRRAVDREVARFVEDGANEFKEWTLLIHPDEQIRRLFFEAMPDATEVEADEFLRQIRIQRAQHPYFVEDKLFEREELVAETTGSNIFDCMQVSELMDSYLLTDLDTRWLQYRELARQSAEGMRPTETGVAFALQNLKLPMARQIDLGLARRIRAEGQLSRVRGLLNGIMRSVGSEEPISVESAKQFEHELIDEIESARDEYAEIERSLLSHVSAQGIAAAAIYGLTGGALTISLGALATSSALSLVQARMKRRSIGARLPAAMLLQLDTKD